MWRGNTERHSRCLSVMQQRYHTAHTISVSRRRIRRLTSAGCQPTTPGPPFITSSGQAQSVFAYIQCESKKSPPPRLSEFFHFFHKRLRIFNRFLTHLLHVPMYAILQIFIQLSPTLTKLCHIKRDYLVHMRKMSKTRQNARVQTFA